MKTLNLALAFLLSAILFVGCMTTEAKMKKFVKDYNNGMKTSSNPMIVSSNAEISGKQNIRITTVFSVSEDKFPTELIGNIMPPIMTEAIRQIPIAQTLLKENVKFEFQMKSNDLKTFYSMVIDQKKYEALKASNNEALANEQNKSGISKDVDNMIAILNKSLPYKDPETGVSVVKVTVESKSLIYKCVVPENLVTDLKKPEYQEATKTEILNTPGISSIVMNAIHLGLNGMAYKYYDPTDNLLFEVKITESDVAGK